MWASAERRAVGVVVHEHRHAEAAAELLAQRHAGERDVDAGLDRAGGVARSARARRPRSPRARPTRSIIALDGRLDAVEQRLRRVRDRGVLGRLADRHSVDRRHGDLRAAYVDAEDHAWIPITGGPPPRVSEHSFAPDSVRMAGVRSPRPAPPGRRLGPRRHQDPGGRAGRAPLRDRRGEERHADAPTARRTWSSRWSRRWGRLRRRRRRARATWPAWASGSPGAIDIAPRRGHRRRATCPAEGAPFQIAAGFTDARRHARVRGQRRDRGRQRRVRARRGTALQVAAGRVVGHRRGRRDRAARRALGRPRRGRPRSVTWWSRSAAPSAPAAGAAAWRRTPAAARWRSAPAAAQDEGARPTSSRSWRSAGGPG